VAGCATQASSAGHAPVCAETVPKLTLPPDHSKGAGHGRRLGSLAEWWLPIHGAGKGQNRGREKEDLRPDNRYRLRCSRVHLVNVGLFMGDSVMRGRFIFTVLALALSLLSISSVTKAEPKYDPEMIAECDKSFANCRNNCRNGTTIPLNSSADKIHACEGKCHTRWNRCTTVGSQIRKVAPQKKNLPTELSR